MSETPKYLLEQKQIREFLPHRYPILLVDRILEISGPNVMDDDNPKNKVGIKVYGQKNVSANEPFFVGHFPEAPIMPGVLIVETMAQVAAFSMYPLMIKSIEDAQKRFQMVLAGVDNARFRVPVVPGDTLRIETEVTGCRTSLWTFSARAMVEGKLVAEANLLANLVMTTKGSIF